MKKKHRLKVDEELLVTGCPAQEEDLHFHLMMTELVDQLQEATPLERQTSTLRKMVSCFGDAYFFHDHKGDFCLLTDFLRK